MGWLLRWILLLLLLWLLIMMSHTVGHVTGLRWLLLLLLLTVDLVLQLLEDEVALLDGRRRVVRPRTLLLVLTEQSHQLCLLLEIH